MSVSSTPVYTLGVDIGSSTSKCVVLADGATIIASVVEDGGAGTGGPDRALGKVLDKAGLSERDMAYVAATGYGRNTFSLAHKTYSELSCHARGAAFLRPGTRTVVDIGGQDCKAMVLTPDGKLDSFAMNDKCAAGTGRFLEVMARILEIPMSGLAEYDMRAEGVIEITSTCTVFAESEVISQLSKGADKPSLVAGIHRSAAAKAAAIAKRLNAGEPVFFTGGVAQNVGVVKALERELGVRVETHELSQLAGALGAALFAYQIVSEGMGTNG